MFVIVLSTVTTHTHFIFAKPYGGGTLTDEEMGAQGGGVTYLASVQAGMPTQTVWSSIFALDQ